MEVYLSDQALAFLWSAALGLGLGGFYDLFRIGRILRGRQAVWMVFLQDLLFALAAAMATALCFTLSNYGQVRLFLLIGEGLGFLIYYYTLGRLSGKIAALLRPILAYFGKAFKKIMNFLKKPFIFFFRWVTMKMHICAAKLKERGKPHEGHQNAQSKE